MAPLRPTPKHQEQEPPPDSVTQRCSEVRLAHRTERQALGVPVVAACRELLGRVCGGLHSGHEVLLAELVLRGLLTPLRGAAPQQRRDNASGEQVGCVCAHTRMRVLGCVCVRACACVTHACACVRACVGGVGGLCVGVIEGLEPVSLTHGHTQEFS